ncbi:PspA/IM30 family protein [Sphaerobacter thermophilus]|jgi:phage shock protein A|uniref:Phage shock protein A, PspA n=1 Tax=Sphaerobacter thermophilus (strain ATCC 49802 / DSM 20745 / KCCM 41009 / NCIMB 13125 / S 6022) TaxID=479434 RepID=D1C2Q6_SPHTD|nr:PspA/IM30 family protein [Sphaerobacter thermophilus]ACZ38523.1 phage shock protein A, PspA [Sphaerobacter thermophilus DSM 20745]PZN67974.1 MAG: PspA/IM30 family protein [Sphaerobacter thermophilus]
MGLLSRFTTLIKVKVNRLLGAAEDPRETLDYSYERQLEMLQQVKRGVVEVATSKRRLELQKAKLQESVNRLNEQARQAVAVGRDDLARAALERRAMIQQQLADLDQQTAQLDQEQAKLEQAETRLRMKIESFRTRKEVVKAQYSAAEAQVRIGEAVTGLSEELADVGLALDRAQEKTEQLQARAGAIDELIASGALEDFTTSGRDAIERELAQITVRESVDAELAALKAELGAPEQPKTLPEGGQQ